MGLPRQGHFGVDRRSRIRTHKGHPETQGLMVSDFVARCLHALNARR